MTSATFVTAGCGNCHPGGGPLEFDREGKRHDTWMRDPARGLTPGGDNHFDGDYFKTRWSETGVVEADCLLCHLPEYDKPTEVFRPVLADYKGKIYPVNRVHSTWPGIETPGQPGLMQPRPPDIHKMWKAHFDDSKQSPELARIEDDDGDGAIEINRPDEVDALIAAVTRHLTTLGYELNGRRVVWVSNERVYSSGTEYRAATKAEWEASPYANVHMYNHDIAPARAALGSGGCTDCHAADAGFFNQAILRTAFTPDDQEPRWVPNYTRT